MSRRKIGNTVTETAKKRRRGTSMIETVVILPVILLLFFGKSTSGCRNNDQRGSQGKNGLGRLHLRLPSFKPRESFPWAGFHRI